MDNDLPKLVKSSTASNWRETLAIVSCFAQTPQEFAERCTQLGDLIVQSNIETATDSALLCYMCACNVEKVVGIWLEKSQVARQVYGIREWFPVYFVTVDRQNSPFSI